MAATTMEGLGKIHEGGTRAVGGVDLEIEDGEFLVLMGPSGCKTNFVARVSPDIRVKRGVTIQVAVDCEKLLFFDPAPGRRIGVKKLSASEA